MKLCMLLLLVLCVAKTVLWLRLRLKSGIRGVRISRAMGIILSPQELLFFTERGFMKGFFALLLILGVLSGCSTPIIRESLEASNPGLPDGPTGPPPVPPENMVIKPTGLSAVSTTFIHPVKHIPKIDKDWRIRHLPPGYQSGRIFTSAAQEKDYINPNSVVLENEAAEERKYQYDVRKQMEEIQDDDQE